MEHPGARRSQQQEEDASRELLKQGHSAGFSLFDSQDSVSNLSSEVSTLAHTGLDCCHEENTSGQGPLECAFFPVTLPRLQSGQCKPSGN